MEYAKADQEDILVKITGINMRDERRYGARKMKSERGRGRPRNICGGRRGRVEREDEASGRVRKEKEIKEINKKHAAFNRGPEAAPIHLLPQVWARNTWSWGILLPFFFLLV